MKRRDGIAAVAILFALAACHTEKKANDQRSAAGKVLPGSINDAMIPYDQLTSQPPLAPETAEPGTADADDPVDAGTAPAASAATPADAASSAQD